VTILVLSRVATPGVNPFTSQGPRKLALGVYIISSPNEPVDTLEGSTLDYHLATFQITTITSNLVDFINHDYLTILKTQPQTPINLSTTHHNPSNLNPQKQQSKWTPQRSS
jgi:hypothetical protein